jgi:hypothetical protein
MVTSFSDEDLRAIVETAKMSNPEAESYLLDVLKKRRDRTSRYWFAKVNPLDRFRVAGERAAQRPLRAGTGGGSNAPAAPLELRFDDLMVEAGLAPAGEARYAYVLHHEGARLARGVADEPAVPLGRRGRGPRAARAVGRTLWRRGARGARDAPHAARGGRGKPGGARLGALSRRRDAAHRRNVARTTAAPRATCRRGFCVCHHVTVMNVVARVLMLL